ncbi:hypothetical protein RB4659 [Rhodopirellula baltica SH 1]|uniref:Uncharacterized protein n=1 Tax=Rhodopirellula baltica (strain DSM 10527 / NCIMB 13988 / SH1) TaxID=243090 RepID=Q7US78_RHOBA|nr:hypothetical protein RB4659 [Rhodopirellula baltica SH 1]
MGFVKCLCDAFYRVLRPQRTASVASGILGNVVNERRLRFARWNFLDRVLADASK